MIQYELKQYFTANKNKFSIILEVIYQFLEKKFNKTLAICSILHSYLIRKHRLYFFHYFLHILNKGAFIYYKFFKVL